VGERQRGPNAGGCSQSEHSGGGVSRKPAACRSGESPKNSKKKEDMLLKRVDVGRGRDSGKNRLRNKGDNLGAGLGVNIRVKGIKS